MSLYGWGVRDARQVSEGVVNSQDQYGQGESGRQASIGSKLGAGSEGWHGIEAKDNPVLPP